MSPDIRVALDWSNTKNAYQICPAMTTGNSTDQKTPKWLKSFQTAASEVSKLWKWCLFQGHVNREDLACVCGVIKACL
jgi:hypothetical protein